MRNRESRPEDLHLIAELREMVSEREALVKKLVVRNRAGSVGIRASSWGAGPACQMFLSPDSGRLLPGR